MLYNIGFDRSAVFSDVISKFNSLSTRLFSSIELFANENFTAVVKKGNDEKYETIFKLPDFVKAPMKAGDKVGSVVVTKDGNVIKEIDVIIRQDVKHNSYFDNLNKIAENW